MNITIVGWVGYSNTGDESYKLAFPLLFPNYKITFTNNPKGYDFSKTDLIILGGGDVVKTSFTKYLKDVPVRKIAASVTLTKDSDLENLKIFDKVIVRDLMSLELAGKYHSKECVSILPDFSFALKPDAIKGRSLIDTISPAKHVLTDKIVTVCLNSYISYNSDDAMSRDVIAFQKMIHELARIAEAMDTSWIFLPFSTRSPWDDRAVGSWLGERCKKKYYKNLIIYDKLSVQDTLNIIAASTAVVSTRLHSSIFSTLAGTPFVDILHHDKNLGFLKTIGREPWGTWLWNFDQTKVQNQLRYFISDNAEAIALKKIGGEASQELLSAAPYIL